MKHFISFFVEGDPQGQPRHRSAIIKTKGGPKMRTYAETTKFFMRVVRAAKQYIPITPLTGPLSVDLFFYLPRPAGVPQDQMWCDRKPDRDNLDKSVLDALTRAKMWKDDCQVCDGSIKKSYAAACPPGVHIAIWTLEDTIKLRKPEEVW